MLRADGKCYVIAEAGVNHGGDYINALEMVDIAYWAGADACKFQLFNAAACRSEDQREKLAKLELPEWAHYLLKKRCEFYGEFDYLASVFDCDMVDFAADLGCKVVKVGSGELTNLPMLNRIRERRLGVILSTGMSTTDEVAQAVASTDHAALLHCTSNYPTMPEHCNLRAMKTMRSRFGLPIGFSDHTIGPDAAVMAIAMGAQIIEKHFMLEPGCPDEAVSVTPEVLRGYIATIRRAELMMGSGEKVLQTGEEEMRKVARGRWS